MDGLKAKATHLLQKYYIFNALASISWLYLRDVVPGAELVCVPGSGAYLFETKEREVYMLVGLALLGKLRRANSLHEGCTKLFWYGKLAVGMCLLHCEFIPVFALACAAGALLHVLVPPPLFFGSENVVDLDDATFPSFALNKEDGTLKLVQLTCSWHDGAEALIPLFCGLAADYAGPKRVFASVDVARHPDIATRFNVDLGVRSQQLPTYLLFRNGELQRRLPYFDRSDGTTVVRTRFTRASMESFFLLDVPAAEAARRLKVISSNKGKGPAPAPAAPPRASWNPFRRRQKQA
jgi:thiol-disulfide isomerase/thioredoxin